MPSPTSASNYAITTWTTESVNQYVNASPQGRARITRYVSATVVEAITEYPFFNTTAVDAGRWELEHNIRAALGNEDSRQYVMAADTTGNNAAFIPTPQSTEVINGIANADRGFIDAMSFHYGQKQYGSTYLLLKTLYLYTSNL